MVCYCCVKGCKNNSNIKKKDPNSTISFHAFPSNLEHRTKWLKAIGRPNWEPPSHARICSAHFSFDQISHESCRTRIKDDAYPVNALPLNSNFEASNVEVCRICLATDLKMYSLQGGNLSACMESIAGFNENYNIEGLPQFVCYVCAALLMKCYHLIEKSVIAQATLLDIFAQNGQITKELIKKQNRKELNLVSPLNYHKPLNIFEFTNDDKWNESSLIKIDSAPNECECENGMYLHEQKDNYKSEDDFTNDKSYKVYEGSLKTDTESKSVYEKSKLCEAGLATQEEAKMLKYLNDDSEYFVEALSISSPIIDTIMDDSDIEDSIVNNKKPKKIRNKTKKAVKKRKTVNELTPDEVNMQKYFDVVKLSLQEQIEEWKGTARRPFTSETIHECEICCKTFAHIKSFRTHVVSHDQRRGKAECPVCKLRFKNEVLAKSHRSRTHGKKFYCKSCPKVFHSVGVAKKHHRWHTGYVYQCRTCPFSSAHESALGVHERAHAHEHAHALAAARTCARCGLACVNARGLRVHWATAHRDQPEAEGNAAYRCEQCDISFMSEGARRVHILTSSQHKKKHDLCDTTSLDPAYKTTCSKCGVEFPTLKELIAHTKSEHRRPTLKKTTWRMPDDSYPTHCEHCGETVNNRREHWWHVRRQHPKEKDSYRPVINAICDTCGKGFQSSTKLHLHTLRHGRPSVRCASCPRLFYDKYAAARHAAVHAPAARPHACPQCGRAFRLRANLHRHKRVHTGATPYECTMCGKKFKYSTSVNLHVRTVHYKLPHPPRKKRTRNRSDSININSENIM